MAHCSEPFYDYLVKCTDEINVNALLAPATTYKWVIHDKFEREYSGTALTDGDGFLSIPVEDLPEGLLTEFSGTFALEIFSPEDECRPIVFKAAKYYEKMVFHVKAGTNEKNNLGCSFDCITPSGSVGSSSIFTFEDTSEVVISWTSFLNTQYGYAPTVQVYHLTGTDTYELVNVSVILDQNGYFLDSITVENGGPATGYVVIS